MLFENFRLAESLVLSCWEILSSSILLFPSTKELQEVGAILLVLLHQYEGVFPG